MLADMLKEAQHDENRANAWAEYIKEKSDIGKHDTVILNLPTNITIGIELEFLGISEEELKKQMRYPINWAIKHWPEIILDWNVKLEHTVKSKKFEVNQEIIENGVECTSPILEDTEFCWKNFEFVCEYLKLLGAYTNSTCGGHIHIGANVLGTDTKAWQNFIKIYREIEPLLYVLSNKKDEITRSAVGEYARPLGESIDLIDINSIRVKSEEDLKNLVMLINGNDISGKYKGLNLQNISKIKNNAIRPMNTIEFRIPNGTLEYDVIRENILLYGRILGVSKLCSVAPLLKQREFEMFLEPNLEEREKLERFLNLAFDSEKEKQIFRERWEYNAGREEVVDFKCRKYKRQEKQPKMIEQIRMITKLVNKRKQMLAMKSMIEDLTSKDDFDVGGVEI